MTRRTSERPVRGPLTASAWTLRTSRSHRFVCRLLADPVRILGEPLFQVRDACSSGQIQCRGGYDLFLLVVGQMPAEKV